MTAKLAWRTTTVDGALHLLSFLTAEKLEHVALIFVSRDGCVTTCTKQLSVFRAMSAIPSLASASKPRLERVTPRPTVRRHAKKLSTLNVILVTLLARLATIQTHQDVKNLIKRQTVARDVRHHPSSTSATPHHAPAPLARSPTARPTSNAQDLTATLKVLVLGLATVLLAHKKISAHHPVDSTHCWLVSGVVFKLMPTTRQVSSRGIFTRMAL